MPGSLPRQLQACAALQHERLLQPEAMPRSNLYSTEHARKHSKEKCVNMSNTDASRAR